MSDKERTYHDLVIKDGKFIGEFDRMYREFDDPWMQSSQPNPYSRMAGMLHMQRIDAKSILECGCGLGYYAEQIHERIGIMPVGIDISEQAIRKARERNAALNIAVGHVPKDLHRYSDVDVVLFAEIIWYILPDLQETVAILRKHFVGKHLVVNQVFYKASQRYGTEYFTDSDGFIEYMGLPVIARCTATAENEETIETSTLFRIQE